MTKKREHFPIGRKLSGNSRKLSARVIRSVKREDEGDWNYDSEDILCEGPMQIKGLSMQGYTTNYFVLLRDGIMVHFKCKTKEDRVNCIPSYRSKPVTCTTLSIEKPNIILFSFGDAQNDQEFRVLQEDVDGTPVTRDTWHKAVQDMLQDNE